ncbi:MAG: hypothetical protein ABID54_07100, partial [Pseudomonadota bacterium]
MEKMKHIGAKSFRGDSKVVKSLEQGALEDVFPGAVLLLARAGEVLFFEAVGHASLIPEKSPMAKDTIFDLA